MSKYNYITKKSLEQEILIMIRNKHVSRISSKLIEQNIISNQYIDNLIKTSNKYVLIYSSNYNDDKWQQHVRHRKFEEALPKNLELVQKIDTIFDDCSADFYLYKIINAA
jgi:hypothetical protein